VVTNDEKIAERVIMLRDHGRLGKKYEHEIEGCNSRLDVLQAAILNVKLKHLEGWNEQRRRNARLYDELLLSVPGIRTPTVAPWGTHVYHLYVVRVKAREVMQQRLYQEGIATGIHYPIPLHLQKAYRYLGYRRGDFPVTEELSEEIISLPMYPELTQDDIVMIVEKIKDFVTRVGT
jgi:dTDP-4-amino-4,6-dideoxygalactose transaminase